MNFSPVFGSRVDGCPYIVRPSAYALVRDATSAVAVVHTPSGVYLPGGGIEGEERPDQTVVREAQEECGLVLRPGPTVGRAVQIAYSVSEQTCFEKHCVFLTADVVGTTTAMEADHTLAWLMPGEALASLTHESHRWALQRLLESERNTPQVRRAQAASTRRWQRIGTTRSG